MNFKEILNRFKSPVVLFGVVALLIQAAQVDPSTLTSWGVLWDNIVAFVNNPFQLATAIYIIFAYINNPSDKDNF